MEFNEGKYFKDKTGGKLASQGLSVHAQAVERTGNKILLKTKELQRKEAQITGNNPESVVNTLARDSYNEKQKKIQADKLKQKIKLKAADVLNKPIGRNASVASQNSQKTTAPKLQTTAPKVQTTAPKLQTTAPKVSMSLKQNSVNNYSKNPNAFKDRLKNSVYQNKNK